MNTKKIKVRFAENGNTLRTELKENDNSFKARFGQVHTLRGEDGKSAYDIAVENGFEGTEAEWLASLHGKDGKTPVKSVDYFTEEDVQEIVDKVAEEMPTPVTSWNDLTDKPFGEMPPAFDIAWDGDMTGHDTFLLEENVYLVKVSDEVFTKEQLIGATYYCDDGYEEILAEEAISEDSELGIIAIYSDILVVTSATDFIAGAGLPEGSFTNGVWFINVTGEGGFYVSRLVASSTIKTLDNKFLDLEGYAKTEDLSTVATSGSWNDLTDKPFWMETAYTLVLNVTFFGQQITTIFTPVVGKNYKLEILDQVNNVLASNTAQCITGATHYNIGELGNSVFGRAPLISLSSWTFFANVFSTGEITLKIYEENNNIKTLDEKYLPDTIARKTDIPKLSAVATSGSWNDLEDKPFGEGPSRWVEVVPRFNVTPTQADNGSYTATVELSFKPENNTKYKIKVTDAQWGYVVYDHECDGYASPNYPVVGYTRYGLGVSGDPVYAYSSVSAGTIPTRWTFEFQRYTGQKGYYVEIYEAKPTLILLDEKFLSETVVLESELDAKGYQTEEQVTALINNAIANLPRYNGEVEEI